MLTGIVKFWNEKRHYGFVTTADREKVTYFVHLNDVTDCVDLQPMMKVQFAPGPDTRTGKTVAKDVKVISRPEAAIKSLLDSIYDAAEEMKATAAVIKPATPDY